MDDRPPVREGYNRDPIPPALGGAPYTGAHPPSDPIIVNWPLVGKGIAVLGVIGAFLTPASIIIWSYAL